MDEYQKIVCIPDSSWDPETIARVLGTLTYFMFETGGDITKFSIDTVRVEAPDTIGIRMRWGKKDGYSYR
jgi:hypothetical protein